VQETADVLRVRVVPAAGFGAGQRAEIEERLRARMGAVRVVFEECAAIPRGPNGKFRAVVCRVAPARDRAPAAVGS